MSEDVVSAETKRNNKVKLKKWISICIAIALSSILYRVLVLNHLEQSALLFMGIPFFLSIAIAMGTPPKTITGLIMKGITLSMMIFGILFIEGLICILMASPLFYLVGAIIGYCIERSKGNYNNKLNCVVGGVLLISSLEGVTDWLSFDREETVIITQEIPLSRSDVRTKLSLKPEFSHRELPLFLKCGFPLPQNIAGTGLKVGDQWEIHFAGGEGKPGDLIVQVTDSEPERLHMVCLQDTSHIAHWLDWKAVEWSFTESRRDTCTVEMTLKYTRLLDPAWYFKPIERYGVRKAGEYFIQQTLLN